MTRQLPADHQVTYDQLFQHPIARNLEWRHLRTLLESLADSVEEHVENIKFTRNGQTLVVHPPRRKDFSDVHQLMKIRHFLETSPFPVVGASIDGGHILVVIDHRTARIYRTDVHGTVPQLIVPFDRNGTGRHLHYVENDATGQRKPEQRSFYAAVARTLRNAENILIFGCGTGASSAMDQLLVELRENHQDIARRVVRTVVVDEPHLSEDQLLAKARLLYAEFDAR
jgi:hypothetical protein